MFLLCAYRASCTVTAMSLAHMEPPTTHAAEPQLTLGERIRKLRMDAGLDQAQLAEAVGVSRQLVSKWERNVSIPDVIEAVTLAEVGNVSFGWLGGVPVRSRWFAQNPQVTTAATPIHGRRRTRSRRSPS